MGGQTDLRIQKGSFFVYRVFDIAEEVNLRKLEELLRRGSGDGRVKIAPKARDAVVVRNAPLRLYLGDMMLGTEGSLFERAQLWATVWDYGSLSLSYQIPFSRDVTPGELLEISALLNSESELVQKIDSYSEMKSRELMELAGPALVRPALWGMSEDYVIYFFESISGVSSARDFLQKVDVPRLLLGEIKESLSVEMREGIMENTFQYGESDVVVIDWNSALVWEPSGQREIPDVIEFALTHLLEVRFYDDLLDRRLSELYARVEAKRRQPWQNPFGAISKEANTRFIEFSEFMERMGNSLKVVGDFYLARIFRGAIRRFRIRDWEESITRKMNLLARVAELLQGQTNVSRGHWLEIVIICLILFEILSTMWHRGG